MYSYPETKNNDVFSPKKAVMKNTFNLTYESSSKSYDVPHHSHNYMYMVIHSTSKPSFPKSHM